MRGLCVAAAALATAACLLVVVSASPEIEFASSPIILFANQPVNRLKFVVRTDQLSSLVVTLKSTDGALIGKGKTLLDVSESIEVGVDVAIGGEVEVGGTITLFASVFSVHFSFWQNLPERRY